MKLSIVLLHYGDPESTTRVLTALNKAWLPDPTEVLVINNGRSGANAKIPFEPSLHFDLQFFEIPNRGYPQGMNFGLARAKGEVLCMLTDVEVEKDTFKVLLNYLESNPEVGVVAPRLVFENGDVQDNFRVFPKLFDLLVKRLPVKRLFLKRMKRYLMWDMDPLKNRPVDWLTGAVQVFTRKCWDAVGPNDERYFLFMSDVDICRTAWEKGFEVHFVGKTQALHSESRLSGGGIIDLFKKPVLRRHILDAMKYFLKWKS